MCVFPPLNVNRKISSSSSKMASYRHLSPVRDLARAAAHSKKLTFSLLGVNLGGLSVFGSTPGFVLYPRGVSQPKTRTFFLLRNYLSDLIIRYLASIAHRMMHRAQRNQIAVVQAQRFIRVNRHDVMNLQAFAIVFAPSAIQLSNAYLT